MKGNSMRRCLLSAISIALVFSCLLPVTALADGTEDQLTSWPVQVSAEKDAALIDGAPYAVDAFSRSQVGSNRDFDGVYQGYSYYMGDAGDKVSAIASTEYVVVHFPPAALEFVGDVDNPDVQRPIKEALCALDEANANGGVLLSSIKQWYFVSDESVVIDGVEFVFAQELKDDQFYSSVIGQDGSNITKSDNPHYLNLTHADFALLVDPEQAIIVEEKTGIDAFMQFITTMDYSPLWVTLKTTSVAIVFIFVLGLLAAYFSLRIPSRAQDIVDSIFTIPMVLPPTVCGFLLLLLFGKNTPVGQWFIDIGFPLIFSWPATVIAAIVVAFPLMYRSARGAFEGLDENMLDAARTLGWSNAKVFFRLMLPLSWSSIAAGTVLALARALGEFGATLFLAGNYLGVTRTIPIAIYFEWMNGNSDVALFWTVVIIIFSFIVILCINIFSRRTTKYRRRSES